MTPDPKKSQELFQCPYVQVVACPTCDRKYMSRDSLREHIKLKHASDGTMQLYKSKIQQRKAPKRNFAIRVAAIVSILVSWTSELSGLLELLSLR